MLVVKVLCTLALAALIVYGFYHAWKPSKKKTCPACGSEKIEVDNPSAAALGTETRFRCGNGVCGHEFPT